MAASRPWQPAEDGQPGTEIAPSAQYVAHAMPQILTSTDIVATVVIILFVITNDAKAIAGGPLALTCWLLAGLTFFIPCAVVTAQLSALYPYDGSVYTWTYRTFGRYMSFFVGFCAWIPGPLLMMATADLIVTYLQNFNLHWLTEPWQQGLAIIIIITITGILATQGHRLVQNLVNMAAAILLLEVALLCIAAIVWHVKGNPMATNFSAPQNWLPMSNATSFGNFFHLFGVLTLAYLGVNVAMNTGGELSQRPAEPRKQMRWPLLWGALLVLVCYVVSTTTILMVRDSHAAYNNFAIVQTVSLALGPLWGNIAAIGLLTVFTVAAIVYNTSFARYLFVAGIDRRLPRHMGLLNKHRVPGAAIIFQTICALIVATFFFIVIPAIGFVNLNPVSLTQDTFSIGMASVTFIWALSTLFLFVNLLQIYRRKPMLLHEHRICPTPLLLICACAGTITGVLALFAIVLNSWTPLLSNIQWAYLVIVPTAFLLLVGIMTALFDASDTMNTEN